MYKQKQAFTLVELIVVITILAILGTIAIMAFSGYSKNARDSARISDISRITSSVELFQVAKGFFPEPSNGVNITYSGATAWTQGTFGDSTVTNVEKINKKPVDPLTGSEYAYSITQSKKEFQIGAVYEGDSIAVVPQTYAAEAGKALIKGNYNGSILKVQSGSTTFVLAIPSILASDIETSTDVEEIVSTQRLVFDKYSNLPASYKGTSYEINGGFDFTPGTGSIVVFSGDTSLLKDEGEQLTFVEKLQAVYGGTVIEGTPEIKNVLSYNATNDEEGTKLLAQVLISDYVDGSVPITALSNTPVGGGGSQGSSPQSNYKLAHGRDFICAVLPNKTVKCWGDNDYGQLGDGTTTDRYSPVAVSGINSAIEIGVGYDHTCVVLTGGSMKCWGKNNYGQLGNQLTVNSPIPVDVLEITNTTYVDAGNNNTCVILNDETVRCWGDNSNYQLGDGTQIDSIFPINPGLTNVKKLKIGSWNEHSVCVVLGTGEGYCWGDNEYGRLGNGIAGGYITTPTEISILEEGELLADIDISNRTACGLLTTGVVKCWGYNYDGQLGDGTNIDSLTPVTVVGITNALSIGVNSRHSCAILQGGQLKCWGKNYEGQLGDGTENSSNVPIDTGINNAVRIALGFYGTVVELANGKLMYFGENDDGQRGNGNLLDIATPISPIGLTNNIIGLSKTAGGGVVCFILNDATIKCSTSGYSTLVPNTVVPTTVPGISGVSKLVFGAYGNHACILTTTGGVKCWGLNNAGQLGNNSTVDSTSLVDVVGLNTGVIDIGLGSDHSCALLQGGTMKCWGYNWDSRLGDGSPIYSMSYSPIPLDVVGTTNITKISLGQKTCIVDSGLVKCWGNEYGDNKYSINGIINATDIIVGGQHACAIDSGDQGKIKCWGDGWAGSLGYGTENSTVKDNTNHTDESVEVSGIVNATQLGGLGSSTCATLSGGQVKCWGNGTSGQLGNGLYQNSFIPVEVSGIVNAIQLGGGSGSRCAILSDSTVKCWGSNDGQLGNDPFQKTEVIGLD